ncbi:hypothetical protein AB4Z52_29500 [Rhizobium sp. 2YAF20]|uniref:hypothetical protein n=1 Tax=Rhizobium sp. 2YAF20 TaxID=3233027 RepID=UPI003F99E12F
MEKRVPLDIIASYLSTTEEVIKAVYGHFSPDFHAEVNDAQKTDRDKRAAAAQKKKASAAQAARSEDDRLLDSALPGYLTN